MTLLATGGVVPGIAATADRPVPFYCRTGCECPGSDDCWDFDAFRARVLRDGPQIPPDQHELWMTVGKTAARWTPQLTDDYGDPVRW